MLCAGANAQTPATPDADSPLAPVQERDQQVTQYDPLAQDPAVAAAKAKAEREAEQHRQAAAEPLPGSIADSETPVSRGSGPTVDDVDAQQPVHDYAGPAVLTRSYSLGQAEIPKVMKWNESVSVSTIYDSGLGNIGPGGPVSAGALQGTQIGWAFSGGRTFAHDSVGFSTGGGYSYYPGNGFYTGANSSVSAFWSHVISRRLSTNTTFTGALLSANSALTNQSPGAGTIANINLAASPNIGVLDNGSKQGSLGSSLNWKLTNRLSASFSGSYFAIIRDSALLAGVSGTSSGANLSYRLTRKMTIGATYSFSQYVYPHGAQTSDTQSAGMIFSYALDRSTQIRFNGGLSHTESLGLQVIPLNPIIAAILGQSQGVIDAYQSITGTNISAQIVRDFHHGNTVSLAYARGITPGNGLFNTSMMETLTLTAGIRMFRQMTLSFSSGWEQMTAVGQGFAPYIIEFAQVSTSQKVGHGISGRFSISYRHFDIATLGSLQNELSIGSGVTWGNNNGRLLPF
jgi:hypothetical protein